MTRRTANAQKTALLGILCAQAIALSALEGMLPSFIPLPGAKLGLSNIVTMFCVCSPGAPYAVTVVLFKAVFALFTRGTTAFFLSLSGGALSLLVMLIVFRLKPGIFGYTGAGILCAIAHNAGQLITASVILGEGLFNLAPMLALMSVITGLLTGTALKLTLPVLNKQCVFLLKDKLHNNSQNISEKR